MDQCQENVGATPSGTETTYGTTISGSGITRCMSKPTRESMKLIGMFAATCLALAITPATTWSADARDVGLAFEEIAPPQEEANAIRLSGKSENSIPETWLRMRGTEAPPWWLGPTGRIVVRNVSRATLTPFLPDSAKATGAAIILAPGGGTLVLGMDL